MALSTPYTAAERLDRLRNRGGWDSDDISDDAGNEIIADVVEWINQYGQEDYDTTASGLAEAIIISRAYILVLFKLAGGKSVGVNYRLGELMENDSSLVNSLIRLIKEEQELLARFMRMFDYYLIDKEDEDFDQFTFTNMDSGDNSPDVSFRHEKGIGLELVRCYEWQR